MTVFVCFYGLLGLGLGTGEKTGVPLAVSLPENSTYRDLLREIDVFYGDKFRSNIWDRKNRRFKIPVHAILSSGKLIQDDEERLHDKETIRFIIPIGGG